MNKTITTEQRIANAAISDMLTIGATVLAYIGEPAHHSRIYAVAAELGFPTEKIENVNPRMWDDWRKKSDGSGKFRFYGKSVFGLTAFGDKFPEATTDPAPYCPARKKTEPKPLTPEQKVAKIAELEKMLAALKAPAPTE